MISLFRLLFSGVLLGATVCSHAPTEAAEQTATGSTATTKDVPMTLTTKDMDNISETFGNFIGKNLKSPGINLNLEKVLTGIRNGAEGKPAPLTDQEFETMMGVLQAQAFSKVADQNLKEANEFLEKNKSERGIVSTEGNKLQYQVITPGSGDKVTSDNTPLINYKGTYLNGTVFGSSEETGGPITIPLNQTIPGFSKGIVGMAKGEKRKLFIHPDLGYGTSGALQPNSLLIFEVEVIEPNHKDDSAEDQEE